LLWCIGGDLQDDAALWTIMENEWQCNIKEDFLKVQREKRNHFPTTMAAITYDAKCFLEAVHTSST